MKKPKISVLTPVYNTKPDALRAMIDSILSQTFTDFEFLILNDSPNNTELDNIVMSYTDKRIRYMKNDCNMGITKSRNKLIDLARGEYLAIADHDDISMPDRLKLESDFTLAQWAEMSSKSKRAKNTQPHNDQSMITILNYH